MNRKNFFASLVMLVALASAGFAQTVSPSSCPNQITFGQRAAGPLDPSAQAQVEVTYFSTDDPNAFISERAGLSRSTRYALLNTGEFVAKLHGLQREGVASMQKRQVVTSYFGELAELDLERDAVNVDGGMINASQRAGGPGRDYTVERETQVSVTRDPRTDGDAYRVSTLTWFVDATAARGGFKVVDDDSSVLLKPGQTALIKLASDYEVKRSGSIRKYMAVTLRSAGPVGLASAR